MKSDNYDALTSTAKEAQEKGLSYGQYQAKEYASIHHISKANPTSNYANKQISTSSGKRY